MAAIVRSAADRSFKYNLKQDPDHIAKVNKQQQKRMEARHRKVQQSLAALEIQAKTQLGFAAVHSCQFVNYLNFVRECWSLKERFSGEALCVDVAVVQLKWKTRGLDNDVLSLLRSQVLTIEEPTTPII